MDIWEEFETNLCNHLPKSDGIVISMLQRKYLRTNEEFRRSKECRAILRQCIDRIVSQPNRIYMILNDLKTTLKLHTTNISLGISSSHKSYDKNVDQQKDNSTDISMANGAESLCDLTISNSSKVCPGTTVAKSPLTSTGPEPSDVSSRPINGTHGVDGDDHDHEDVDDDDVIILDMQPTPSAQPVTSASTLEPSASASSTQATTLGTLVDHQKLSASRRAIITRLEGLLVGLGRAIRQLEEQELDLDALESPYSSYMQLDGLKRRYLEVWRRLCDARRVSRISGRILRRRFSFTSCRFPRINQRIDDLVNRSRKFPDYTDIRRIVTSVNKEDNLGLNSSAVSSLAREVFVDVGHMLKRRRQDDLRHDFGCHLTDDLREEDDPTYSNPVLRRQLAHNKHVGEVKLNSIFDEFVKRQHDNMSTMAPEVEHDTSLHHSTSTSDSSTESDENSMTKEAENCTTHVDQPIAETHDVVTLSSDSELELSVAPLPSTADVSSRVPSKPISSIIPRSPSPMSAQSPCSVINLTDDDAIPLCPNESYIPAPQHLPPLESSTPHLGALVPCVARANPFQHTPIQPCPSMSVVRATTHQTVMWTQRFGFGTLETAFISSRNSTTQAASSDMFCCHDLAANMQAASTGPLLIPHFMASSTQRPPTAFRHQHVTSTRFGRIPRDEAVTSAPDCELIVLD